jgi:signal recognition particle subunit SRP54
MFENLTKKLDNAFKTLSGQGKLTEKNMQDGMQQVRLALLEADVNYKVVKKFIEDVTEKAMGAKVLDTVNPKQMLIKIVHDELCALMGNFNEPLKRAEKSPTIIMMVGLQGQGKTTTCGKLALHLRKKGHKCLLVGADVYRPAAIKQLEVVAGQASAEFFSLGEHANPVDICLMARGEAQMRRLRHHPPRHGGPTARGRADDGRGEADRRAGEADRNSFRRERDDRSGRG